MLIPFKRKNQKIYQTYLCLTIPLTYLLISVGISSIGHQWQQSDLNKGDFQVWD